MIKQGEDSVAEKEKKFDINEMMGDSDKI